MTKSAQGVDVAMKEESGGPKPRTSSLAKFKASQDLRIQTENLIKDEPSKRSSSSGSSTATGSVADTPSALRTPETPVPPSSTGKKRRRRTAAQIDRKFPCTYPSCTKAYGSEGSLTQHQRLKHRSQPTDATTPNNQVGSFFLPLHRTPRSSPAGMFHANGGVSRTVNIRPAMDGLLPLSFDVAGGTAAVPEHDVANEFLTSGSEHTQTPRKHLRARSNSMPVSITGDKTCQQSTQTTARSTPSKSRPQSVRRNRTNSTPRSKPPIRRTKSRSKSESLAAVNPFVRSTGNENRELTRNHSYTEMLGFGACLPPFDWCTMLQNTSSTSSGDDAIDSDILSVLADCDTSDTGESTLEMLNSSSIDPACMYNGDVGTLSGSMDKFNPIDDNASSVNERKVLSPVSLGDTSPSDVAPFEMKDEWIAHPDAAYLSSHLEKMSMLSAPSGGLEAVTVKQEPTPPITSAALYHHGIVDPITTPPAHALNEMDGTIQASKEPRVATQHHPFTLPNNQLSTAKFDSPQMWTKDFTAKFESPQMWTKDFSSDQGLSSVDIDQSIFMDDDDVDVEMFTGSCNQWKSDKQSQPPSHAFGHDGKQAMGLNAFGDSFFLESSDYAMNEARLSSPVFSNQNDL